ncbi:efflux RND transporter periplasmic adaptor subunit [Maribacter arenosus]|uniref:Efflux RND transporter periplasmic adaptor subunit n=1 Tax=Maribacter arenosus TaxID=1854708 RepID=A0ABR7V9Z7_9FLAO|nr:efflux RND transporter periplasmic adaptor subunit [Maribacter arenosus]MBD0849372.1 efflux RND transporter periplasmic adaptor subunit [Maribacter arenosus]
MKSFQYIIFFLSILLVSTCGDSTNSSTDTEASTGSLEDQTIEISKAQFDGDQMQLGKLSEQSFQSMVQTTGMIDVPPQNRAIISSFAGGYVQKTPLLVGNLVRKGQMLATLENPEFVEMQQTYLETAEQLTFLKSEFDRQKALFDEQISSQKNFLKAESEYKSALALYNGLKKKLQMLNINIDAVEVGNITSEIALYAPISGSITKMNISKGSYVSPADVILEIINTDHIHLELAVFEKDILKVKEGQKIVFKIPETGEEVYEAEVHLVGTSIDLVNRTVMVHGHLLDDENHGFAVGMFVDAQIITDTSKEPALPDDAIISVDDSHFVLLNTSKDESYSFLRKEVTVGASYNGFTIIKNAGDFSENDLFMVKGAFNLIRSDE